MLKSTNHGVHKQNERKLSIIKKHLAKIINHWRTIDAFILDPAFLSPILFEFLHHIQYDIF